jgi:hypothetical protein
VSQSVRELEWKQEGRIYEIAPGVKARILPTDVAPALEAALQTDGPKRTTQRFIGDFESLKAWQQCPSADAYRGLN